MSANTSYTKRANVTIKGGPEPWRYEVEVNGEKVGYLRAVEFSANVSSVPQVRLDVLGSVEFEVTIISQYAKAMKALMAVKQWSLDNGNPSKGIVDAICDLWVELS